MNAIEGPSNRGVFLGGYKAKIGLEQNHGQEDRIMRAVYSNDFWTYRLHKYIKNIRVSQGNY